MSEEFKQTVPAVILDLLALFASAKPRKHTQSSDPAKCAPLGDDEKGWQPRLRPTPLTEDEAPFYVEVPRDQRGAPHIRSQLASLVAEEASIEAGRMELFSFDDDINARHYIARYERAGLGHLADDHRRMLAEFRAKEIKSGRSFEPDNPCIAKDCDSEARLQRMYGSPAEDQARILQFHRRRAERTVAERRGLPSRFSSYEAV